MSDSKLTITLITGEELSCENPDDSMYNEVKRGDVKTITFNAGDNTEYLIPLSAIKYLKYELPTDWKPEEISPDDVPDLGEEE